MKEVLCKSDNNVYSAKEFEMLSPDELNEKRENLYCIECDHKAWFTRSTSSGKIHREAYFNSHHREDCNLKTSYMLVEDERDSAPTTLETVNAIDEINVNLDNKKGGELAVFPQGPEAHEEEDENNPTGTRNVKGLAGKKYTNKDKTLRQILASLVRFPTFRDSDTTINFFSSAGAIHVEGTVRNEILPFERFRPTEARKHKIYWGLIVSAKKGIDNSIWLNHGDSNRELSIKIFADIADEFLQAFKIKDLDELQGAHVIVVGRGQYAGTGKPVIYCASPNFINLQRYRTEYTL